MSGLEEIARSHYQNGEYAQALSAWLELSQNFPRRDDYLVSSGNCFDALGDKKAAAGYYLKAHKVNKKSLPALTNLAIACYETDDLKAAEKYSRQALKLDAESLPALINLGNVLYRKKTMPPRCNIIGRPPNCVRAITSPKSTWPIHILNCGIMPPPQNMLKAPPLWIPDRCKPGRCWEMRRWKTAFLTRHWTLLPKRRKSILPIPGYTIIFRRLTRKNRSGKKRSKTAGRLWKKRRRRSAPHKFRLPSL